jgi:hypothetical protein
MLTRTGVATKDTRSTVGAGSCPLALLKGNVAGLLDTGIAV